jgi:hypothetical protein
MTQRSRIALVLLGAALAWPVRADVTTYTLAGSQALLDLEFLFPDPAAVTGYVVIEEDAGGSAILLDGAVHLLDAGPYAFPPNPGGSLTFLQLTDVLGPLGGVRTGNTIDWDLAPYNRTANVERSICEGPQGTGDGICALTGRVEGANEFPRGRVCCPAAGAPQCPGGGACCPGTDLPEGEPCPALLEIFPLASFVFAEGEGTQFTTGLLSWFSDSLIANPQYSLIGTPCVEGTDPGDPDCDGIRGAADDCPHHRQTSTRNTTGSGRGDECLCGDQNDDGRVDVNDILAINAAIFNPSLETPRCDASNDGACDINDILRVNGEIFSPLSSTCARSPVAGQ